jgi:uncharacterized membrane protein
MPAYYLYRNPHFLQESPAMVYGATYITTLILFLFVDMIWLGTMTERFYRPILGDILVDDVRMAPAIAFYFLYPVGLMIFAVLPALKSGNLINALLLGVLFGLFTYGTYDLTNQATVRNWTTGLTLVDMAWGGVLGGLTSAGTCWIVGRLGFQL